MSNDSFYFAIRCLRIENGFVWSQVNEKFSHSIPPIQSTSSADATNNTVQVKENMYKQSLRVTYTDDVTTT